MASYVLELNGENFRDVISQRDLLLTAFISPSCSVCQDIEPEYNEAASNLHQKNITVAKVDCIAQPELCKEQEIGIYPTIKSFKGLDDGLVYIGPRTASAFTTYTLKQALPLVSLITKATFKDFISNHQVVVMAFLGQSNGDEATEIREIMASISDAMRETNFYVFGVTNDPSLDEVEGISSPSIVLYKQYDEKRTIYGGPLGDEAAIDLWVKRSALPLIDEVNVWTQPLYGETLLPIAYVFLDKPEDHERISKDFKQLAARYRSKLAIVTIGLAGNEWRAEQLGLEVKGDNWPAIAIKNYNTNTHIALDQSKVFNIENIGQLFDEYLASVEQADADIQRNDEANGVVKSQENKALKHHEL